MKNNKKIISSLTIMVLSLLFYNCSNDLEYHEHKTDFQDSRHIFKIINLKAIQGEKAILEKINNATQIQNISQNNYSKIVNDSINNFYVDTETGIFIETNTSISYTFKVVRENGSNFLLENLVISKEDNKDFETYLYQYDITREELEMIVDNISIDLSSKIHRITLEDSNLASEVLSKEYYDDMCAVDITTYTPGQTCTEGGNHTWSDILNGSSCSGMGTLSGPWPGYYTTTTSLQPCPSSGGGDDSGGSNGSTSSGEGGGGGGSVTTTPVTDCRTCYQRTPCDKINDLISQSNIQSELSTMSSKTAETTEWGRYKLSTASVVQTPPSSSAGAVEFPFPASGQYVFMAHTHNSPASSTYSIFSYEDILTFAKLLKNNKIDSGNFVAFLATADGTYYALTIENTNNFLKFFALNNDLLYDPTIATKRVEQASKYYGELVPNPNPIIDYDTPPLDSEKAFLDFIQDNNLGIALYESNSTFTTFERIVHNKTTGNIDKQPCP